MNKLKPLIKWTGGKTQELSIIHSFLPTTFNNFYEPFLGGGAVWLSLYNKPHHFFVNDFSYELISFYKLIQLNNSSFYKIIEKFNTQWEEINKYLYDKNQISNIYELYLEYKNNNNIDIQLILNKLISLENNLYIFDSIDNLLPFYLKYISDKLKRIYKNEIKKGSMTKSEIFKNIETGFKSALYMFIRSEYNIYRKKFINKDNISNQEHIYWISLYFILRNYSYSGMFRYNKNNEFNVPYGGISYNSKNLKGKLDYFKSNEIYQHFSKTSFYNLDFEEFLEQENISPKSDDFIFLDPPYDSEFSSYEGNLFEKKEQERLAYYLIFKCKAKWMMVIKYTDFIFDLYNNKENINIISFDKKYQVSFMGRNNQEVSHILIKNY
jgi:DNA adenine methylase